MDFKSDLRILLKNLLLIHEIYYRNFVAKDTFFMAFEMKNKYWNNEGILIF